MWAVDNVVGVKATGPGHRPMILGLFPTHHLLIQVSHILSSSSTNGQVTVWDLVGQKKRMEFHAGIAHDDGRESLRIAIVRLTAIYLHAIGYVG